METIDSILEFWFGTAADDAVMAKRQARLWWQKDPQADATIRQRFESHVRQAANGELDAWAATPPGVLALILLTDQFPRNMYRDTPQAFAFDTLARGWCKQGLATAMDFSLRPMQRVFFYLPLEHSEALPDQQQSVVLFEKLAAGSGGQTLAGYVDYARRHHDIIARFGRFPHRNRILGRASTAEELVFLTEKGSSF